MLESHLDGLDLEGVEVELDREAVLDQLQVFKLVLEQIRYDSFLDAPAFTRVVCETKGRTGVSTIRFIQAEDDVELARVSEVVIFGTLGGLKNDIRCRADGPNERRSLDNSVLGNNAGYSKFSTQPACWAKRIAYCARES
jgi:hypothetical protein